MLFLLGVHFLFAQDFANKLGVTTPLSPLQVVSVSEKEHGAWVLALRNISQKTVVAFAVRSEFLSCEVDYGNQVTGFVPSSTSEVLFAGENLKAGMSRDLDVSAVFADGSSVGPAPLVSYLRGLATGSAVELVRMREIFDGPAASHPGGIDADALRRGIGQPPGSEMEALNVLGTVGAAIPPAAALKRDAPDFLRGFVHGVTNQRQEALLKVDDLERLSVEAAARRTPNRTGLLLRRTQEDYRAMAARTGYFVSLARTGRFE